MNLLNGRLISNTLGTKNCFIKPDGKVLEVKKSFREFASDYCNGICFNNLERAKYSNKNISKEIKRQINVYQTSNLSYEEIKLYDKWKIQYAAIKDNLLIDFLIQVLGFDMIDFEHKTITVNSSSRRQYTKAFPCFDMVYIENENNESDNWKIETLDAMQYDEETNSFVRNNNVRNTFTRRKRPQY